MGRLSTTALLDAEEIPSQVPEISAVFPLAVALSRLPAVELRHGTMANARTADGARLLEGARARILAAPPVLIAGGA